MFKNLLKMYPMLGLNPMSFSVTGDEDAGGPPADPIVDEGNPPPPPAANGDEPPAANEGEPTEISDDQFAALKDVLTEDQFAAIQQTRGMNKRMREKLAKLEKTPAPAPKKEDAPPANPSDNKDFDPIVWVSDTDKGKAAIAHLKRTGMDDDQIRGMLDLIGIMGTRITKWGVDPIASEFREGKFAKALSTFAGDDKYKFVMSKPEIAKEVESYVRNNYQPEDWNKPETLKSAYGNVLSDHPEIFASAGKREIVNDGSPHEKPAGGGAPAGAGVSDSVLETFARDRNLGDIKDTQTRKKVVDAYKAFKAYESGKK
jgi:uncharacterized coiled-coil protein SlyX